MKEKKFEYYSKVANWDFSEIKYEEECFNVIIIKSSNFG